MNALCLELHSNMRLHLVVHVSHKTPHKSQPLYLSQPVTPRLDPIFDASGDLLFEVDRVLGHHKRARGY